MIVQSSDISKASGNDKYMEERVKYQFQGVFDLELGPLVIQMFGILLDMYLFLMTRATV